MLDFTQQDGEIVSSEAECVTQGDSNVPFLGLVESHIQLRVELGIVLVIDFVELMFMSYACSPNTCWIAFISPMSPRGVDVPCVFT